MYGTYARARGIGVRMLKNRALRPSQKPAIVPASSCREKLRGDAIVIMVIRIEYDGHLCIMADAALLL